MKEGGYELGSKFQCLSPSQENTPTKLGTWQGSF